MKHIFAIFVIVVFFSLHAKPNKKTVDEPFISAEYAVLIDAETDECLYGIKENERCAPSSMTKLMTLYLLFSAIRDGQVKLSDEFPVSITAQKMKGSRSFFQSGTTAKVEDLTRSIVVHSGNDACIVIAEGISGDVDIFVDEMNQKAKEFGLKNTNFVNPTGMPNENHFSSVHDLAIISKRIVYDFPQFYHYFSEKIFTVNSITQQNRNTLLGNSLKVDGLKTGKTDLGGYGISVSAKNHGKRLISVVNGCKSAKSRAQDANKLLAFGFKEYIPIKIIEAGKPLLEISVLSGVKDKTSLCTHEDVIAVVPKRHKDLLKVKARIKDPMEAPVILGTKLGELVYVYKNFISKKYDLFAYEPIEQVDIFRKTWFYLKRLISGDNKKSTAESVINIRVPGLHER